MSGKRHVPDGADRQELPFELSLIGKTCSSDRFYNNRRRESAEGEAETLIGKDNRQRLVQANTDSSSLFSVLRSDCFPTPVL